VFIDAGDFINRLDVAIRGLVGARKLKNAGNLNVSGIGAGLRYNFQT
jgi:hypothetical protein